MRTFLQTTWWMLLLRGLALVLLGFFAVAVPGLTLAAFAIGFAAYLIIVGIINLITTFSSANLLPLWFLNVVLAAVEVGVGLYLFRHLTLSIATLLLLVGLVFVVRGILEIISAFGDGYETKHRSMMAIGGAVSLIAGIVVWVYPTSSALAFTWVVGLYGIVVGAVVVALSIEARGALSTGR